MQLIEKNDRDLIGIDSFERGIVFATLLLRQGLREANLESSKVLIYQSFSQENNVKTPSLVVDVKIPYNSADFNGFGGDFIRSVLPFDEDNILSEYSGDSVEPTLNNKRIIEADHEEIESLEQYLIWCLSRWIFFNKQDFPNQWDSWGYLSFLEEARPPVISAKVVLAFDYEKFLITQNLISAVKPRVKPNNDDDENNFTSLIGNDRLFGNSYLVGN